MPDQNTAPKTAAPAPTAEVAKTPKRTFQDWLTAVDFQKQLQVALPKHLDPEHFVRMVLTQTMKTPRLLECSQESLFKCLLDAAAAGLEIDGRRAHLIPFKNNEKRVYEATLIFDYKGLVELCFRSGLISNIHADIVCMEDKFEYDTGRITKHQIDFKKPRGAMYAAYCLIRLKDGTEKAEVMSKEDVDAVRRRSKASGSGPWVTDYSEMAKKTCARRCLKWVPLSAEVSEQIEKDNEFIDLEERGGVQVAKGSLSSQVDGEPETSKEPEASAPTTEPTLEPQNREQQFTPQDREKFVNKLEEHLLNTGRGSRDLLKQAVADQIVKPESLEFDLLELPTGDLIAIVTRYVPEPQEQKA